MRWSRPAARAALSLTIRRRPPDPSRPGSLPGPAFLLAVLAALVPLVLGAVVAPAAAVRSPFAPEVTGAPVTTAPAPAVRGLATTTPRTSLTTISGATTGASGATTGTSGTTTGPEDRQAAQDAAAATTAQAAADAALARVQELTTRAQDQQQVVRQALAGLAQASVDTNTADERAADGRAALSRARALHQADVRAVYAAGGGDLALLTTALGAESPADVTWQMATEQAVLRDIVARGRHQVDDLAVQVATTESRAQALGSAADTRLVAVHDAEAAAGTAQSLLDQARSSLDAYTRHARTLTATAERSRQLAEAAAAARALAAAQAAARARQQVVTGPVNALDIPPDYHLAYQRGAESCPGMSWTLLAAVGQVESGHGRNEGPSSAGAEGPMQFLPTTFARWGVDGDGDGVIDIWDTEDAVFSAARYLCASGADEGTEAGIHSALFAYNHTEWYVQLVLAAQQAIRTRYGS